MSGPEDGLYFIRLATDPKPYIGSNDAPVGPVITGGANNVWTVKKLKDGNYTLILEQALTPRFSQQDEEMVIVDISPPPAHWTIRGQDDGSYAIEKIHGIVPTKAWTLNNPDLGQPVTLDFIDIENPLPNQLWQFRRFPGPE